MRVLRTGLSVLLAGSCAMGAVALSACSSEQPAAEEEQVVEETYVTLGDGTEDSPHMVFLNSTGAQITSVDVQEVTVDEANNEVKQDAIYEAAWNDGEKVMIYAELPGSTDAEDEGQEANADEPDSATNTDPNANDLVMSKLYNLTLTLSDGTAYALHNLTFSESEEVIVLIDPDTSLAYITYVDEDGNDVSLLEAEIAIYAAEQAQIQAEQAAAAAAAAAEQAAAQAASSSTSSGSSSGTSGGYSYDTGSGSGSGSGSGASQTQDVCVDDIVFND